jgi:signal transduction histidine kinase
VKNIRPPLLLLTGLLCGFLLAALDRILPVELASGSMASLLLTIDWVAPPVAGILSSAAILYALRHKRLLASERAASLVLVERLHGTERRQAIWVVAAAVAHDLKNPLHNLQLLLEELELEPARTAELLPLLRNNATRATERLTELARVGQSLENEAGPLRVSEVLEQLRRRLEPSAVAQHTDLTVACPRDLEVRANALALRSAVENVAANALTAIEQQGGGGRLSIRAERAGQNVDIWIEDDGPGIPEDVRGQLFTPFIASGSGSTGLGLAIARALARSSGGDLTCPTTHAGSTRFRFSFPVDRA